MAADYVLFVGWNRAIPGREKPALEVFRSSLAYYNELKMSGQIASFEPVLLDAHGGDLNGFILIKGEEAKLDAVLHSEKFRDLVTKAALNVLGIGVIGGWSGESMTKQVERYANVL
jgi:hypothetical protein